MKGRSKNRHGSRTGDERKRLLSAAAIPLVVMILMIIIVVADRDKSKEPVVNTEPEVVKETLLEPGNEEAGEQNSDANLTERENGDTVYSDEHAETDEFQPTDEPYETAPVQLQKDRIPELLDLMKTYFGARAAGDAETMNQLYGIEGLSVTELEAEKTRMRSNSKYLRGFENIETYVKEGLDADSWLIYVTCDIRFHSVETAAPMIMWCYVTKDAEGNYQIQDHESLSPEVLQLVDVASRSEEVRRLASGINGRLKEALQSDEELNEVYGVLRDGSPVYQEEEETEAVQILDGVDAAETSGAETPETSADSETPADSEAASETESGF